MKLPLPPFHFKTNTSIFSYIKHLKIFPVPSLFFFHNNPYILGSIRSLLRVNLLRHTHMSC